VIQTGLPQDLLIGEILKSQRGKKEEEKRSVGEMPG